MRRETNPMQPTTPPNAPLLFPCPACRSEVSPYATICRKCGHPIRSEWDDETAQADREVPPPTTQSAAPVAFAVFAGLCLFAALGCFVSGSGHLHLGSTHAHQQGAEIEIRSGRAGGGDPIMENTARELADLDDREEIAHGQSDIGVGVGLVIPAAILGAMSRARRKAAQG